MAGICSVCNRPVVEEGSVLMGEDGRVLMILCDPCLEEAGGEGHVLDLMRKAALPTLAVPHELLIDIEASVTAGEPIIIQRL